jgi:hypothetical protein
MHGAPGGEVLSLLVAEDEKFKPMTAEEKQMVDMQVRALACDETSLCHFQTGFSAVV